MFKIQVILCPVDFSDASRKAVQYAREFAAGMGASVHLLNVVEPRPMAVDITLNYVPLEEDLEKAAAADLKVILQEFLQSGLKAECSVEFGNPSEVIAASVFNPMSIQQTPSAFLFDGVGTSY